jgi:hypothetical protein
MKMILSAVALTALLAQSNDFVSTWKAPGAGPTSFAGQKVAAVLIVDDHNLRVSAEEALASEISARGPVGVPAYRVIPKEELTKKDVAKGWFERAGVRGLVILRLVETEKEKVYSSAVWSSGYYGNAWNYWGNSWATVYPIGKAREETTITVETMVYDLSQGAPLWAAASRTTDPKNVQTYIKRLVSDVAKRLEKDGLISKSR